MEGTNPTASKAPTEKQRIKNFMTLSNDAIMEKLKYLSLKDILSVAKSSPRMHEIAGQYYQLNYHERAKYERGNLTSYCTFDEISEFNEFVRHIFIDHNSIGSEILLPIQYKSLNEITLYHSNVDPRQFLMEILPQLETLRFVDYYLKCDLHEVYLQHCTKLKRENILIRFKKTDLSLEPRTIG